MNVVGRLVLAAVLVGLGLVVVAHNRRTSINRWFAGAMVIIAGWIVSISLALSTTETAMTVPLGRLAFAFASAIPYCLFRLFQAFGDSFAPQKWDVALGGLCAFFMAASLSPLIVAGTSVLGSRTSFLYGPLHPFFGVYFVLGFGAALVTLRRRIASAAGLTRLQLRYLWFGFVISGVGAITTNLLIPVIWKTSRFSALGPYFALVLASLAAHAIVRHRLMDIKVVVSRGIVYACAIAVAAAMFVGFAMLVSLATGGRRTILSAPAVMMAVVVAILFQPAKRWLQDAMNRYVHREHYDYQQTVRAASRRLSSLLELQPLLTYLADVVRRTLGAEGVSVYLRDPLQDILAPTLAEWSKDGRSVTSSGALTPASSLVQYLERTDQVLVRDEGRTPTDPLRAAAMAELSRVSGEVAIPLTHDRSLSGILLIGPKRSGDPYFASDLELLATLASQAEIAIKNAQLYRQVQLVEAEKRRAERLAATGALAAGIAHEIKNPLVAIRTFAELLPERFQEHEFRGEFAHVVTREIERIDALVGRLRSLAAAPDLSLQELDLRPLVRDILALLRGQLDRANITARTVFVDDLPLVAGNDSELRQLFLNLFVNAIEAMPGGGHLSIQMATHQTLDRRSVAVEIEDTGTGIQEHLLDTIFEPFVTTKPQGSGLGLSICRGIADAHRAKIRAENKATGSGTRIIVEFPILRE